MNTDNRLIIEDLPSEIHHQISEYLFLNLVYRLKKYNEPIHYGHPQYSSGTESGFSLIIYRVSFRTYHYAIRCLEALGCDHINRECGTTIAAMSDTCEENMVLRDRFICLLAEAEEQLVLLGDITPQEYYFLKTNPVIIDAYNTDHQHFVLLEADIDAFSRLIWGEIGWGKILVNDGKTVAVDGCEKILVRFYKKRARDGFLRYLMGIGVVEINSITNLSS